MKINQKLKIALINFSTLLLFLPYATPIYATTTEDFPDKIEKNENETEVLVTSETDPSMTLVESEPSVSVEESSLPNEGENNEELLESTDSEIESTELPSSETMETTESTENTESTETSTSTSISTEESQETSFSSTETVTSDTMQEPPENTETSKEAVDTSQESTEESIEADRNESTVVESDTSSSDLSSGVSTGQAPTLVYPSIRRPLDRELTAQTFVSSDLNGFELPLLQSYTDQREAALVLMALNYLNAPYEEGAQGPEKFDNFTFPRFLYEKVFALAGISDFSDFTQLGKREALAQARPGDLLIWEKEQQIGIYLGQDKFIMADDTLLKEEQARPTKQAVPGVRIFTLHRDQPAEDTDNQDLLTRYDFLRTPDFSISKRSEWTLSAEANQAIAQYPASFHFQENEQTNNFIASIGETARDLGLEYDLFASVLIAQAILESGAGTSGLATAPYYNLFGIKGSLGNASVVLPTQEDNGQGELYQIQSAFRVYPDYQASLEDYVHLIRKGILGNESFYQGVWRSSAKNYLKATAELTGKYATDTFYYNKLNSIIATYQLTRFDTPRTNVSNEMLTFAEIPAEYREKIRFPEYNGQNYNVSGSYGSDQCTWYVYNRVFQLGGKVGDYMGNGADWKETGIREGYQTSKTPRAGYVISFKQGVAGYHPMYGHVAFVEAVGEEGILISEGDASYLSYRVIPNEIALSNGVGYVVPK
ncbi:glucosaminidase domain-containing protein [Enterococcus sp. LJL98]